MTVRPATDRPSQSVCLTAEGRLLLEDRIRLMEITVQELRGVLDDPDRSAESVEALQRATQELDRLHRVLRDSVSLERTPDDPYTVELGDTVTIRLESNESETYIVVHAAEAPVEDRRISVESPLGAALIGRHVGDEVLVRVPGGSYSCTVLAAQRGDPDSSCLASGHRMFTVSRDDTQVVVRVQAPVDATTLHRALTDLIDDQGNHALRVELHEAGFVDPGGAAALVQAAWQVSSRGGRVDVHGCADELGVAVDLISAGPELYDIDSAGLDAAVQPLQRLAFALHGVDSARDVHGLAAGAIGLLEDLLRRLHERAFRGATDARSR